MTSEAMVFRPYPYQQRAIDVIESHPDYGLFLDMGLGKTVITLTAIESLIYEQFEVSRVLIIAPKRVAESTWQDEAKKWKHLHRLRFSTILGNREHRAMAVQKDADIYVINRENVAWLFDNFSCKWDMLVVDESSSFKSPQAVRFKILKKQLPHFRRRVILTGTPTSNTLMDLWSQMYILDMGERLGKTITAYRRDYFLLDKRNQNVIFSYKLQKGAEDIITKKIRDICMSMKAADYITLPRKIVNVVEVKLPDAAKKVYNQMVKDQVVALGDEEQITAFQAATVANKLLQISNGSVYTDDHGVQVVHREKVNALKEIIEESGGQPVLVFYGFRHDVRSIKAEIPGAVELEGKETLDDWNQGKIKVLLAHPASAGYGLNMQAGGHIVVWYGLTWSLEQYQQANARLYRQGQNKPVIIHHIVAADTIDERVMWSLRNKKRGQDSLMAAVKEVVEGGHA